jgi:two-component system response regulator YesN
VNRLFKLLVVDDEAIEREALKFIVKNSNLEISEVMEASNGQEALAIAEKFNPDIVTLDILMPGLSGIETGQILKERNPELKIIFVTAYDSFEYAHEAIKIGVEDFIVKPGSDEQIVEILRSCIVQLEEEQQKKRQRESLEVKINQISGFLENEFVNSVVNGEIDEQHAADYLKFMLDEFEEGFGVVIDIDFIKGNSINRTSKNMVRKELAQKLSELLGKDIRFMVHHSKNTIHILFFGYSPVMRNHCVRLIEDGIRMLDEDLNEQIAAKLYYGFGAPYNSISQLWKSFAQAKAAARNMQLSILENSDDRKPSANSLEITEDELWHSIINGNEEAVVQKADHILDNIIFASNDVNEAKILKLYEFFILMSRYLNRESQLKRAVPDNVFDDLKNIETMGEARKYIHGYLFEVFEALKEQRSNPTPVILDKVIRFINQNYHENLTLEDVAYEAGFSTYYFGKLFKKTFGVTFIDYLTSLRIARAKELLKDPLLTVKDVTYRVGYMDPNYFARVFKKTEGITPTEYRIKFWRRSK